MEIPGVEMKNVVSTDGTRIRYQDLGSGPVIVLANGLGGTFEAWYYLIEHLRKDYRIISWDYRGLYESECPAFSRLTIPDHVEDLRCILEKEKIDKAMLAGWSMGTQVIFEFTIRHPEHVLGLVPICGSAGAPFDTVFNINASRHVMPVLFHAQRKLHKVFSALIRLATSTPVGFEAINATGLFWHGGHEVIRDMVDSFAQLDFEAYAHIMLHLGRHDARAALSEVTAPTLIVAATGDFFTPVQVSEIMRDTLQDSALVVLEGGTHYAPLEFPERINELVDGFLAEKVRWPEKKKKKKAKKASKSAAK
jgi:pimeloyl-ACP methyl ester carboxylesterase